MSLWPFHTEGNDIDPENIEEDFKLLEQEILEGKIFSIKRERVLTHFKYFISTENYKKAHKLLDLLENYPAPLQLSEIYSLRAYAYQESNNIELAIVYISKAIRLEPYNEFHYFTKGKYLLSLNKLELALISFKKSYLLSYDHTTTAYDIADILMEQGYYREAIQYLKIAYQSRDYKLPVIKDLIICYEKINDLEEVIKFIKKHLETFPDDANVWQLLAEAYTLAGYYDHAIDAYKTKIALAPSIKAYIGLAEVLIETGDAYDALTELKICKEFNKFALRNYKFHHVKGKALKELNKFKEAITSFKKILHEVPVEATKNIMECYIKLGQLKLAKEYADRLYELDEEEGIKAKAIVTLAKKNDIVKAMKYATTYLVRFDADHKEWMFWAEQLAKRNFYEEAINLLEYGIKYNYEVPELVYQKIAYMFKNRQMENAINELENILMEHYDKHGVLFHFYPELQKIRLINHIINKYS